MKGKKYKRSETAMRKVFENAFGFRQPYQVLVDAEFCRELLRCKIIAKEILPTVLGGPAKVLASCCVLDELRRLDESAEDGLTGSVFIAKRFEMRTCRHSPARSAVDCLADLVGPANPHHYVVAVQSYDLRRRLRDVLGTPLVFVNRGVVMMEDPTKAALAFAHQKELGKLQPREYELRALAAEKGADTAEDKERKKRRTKRPNPLSVKKAASAPTPAPSDSARKSRKRRPKKRAGASAASS